MRSKFISEINRKNRRGRRVAVSLLALLLGVSMCGFAQAQSSPIADSDAASLADMQPGTQVAEAPAAQQNVPVARLSDVEGPVQMARGADVQFSQAAMNMPLLESSRVNTGVDGRAEIRVSGWQCCPHYVGECGGADAACGGYRE